MSPVITMLILAQAEAQATGLVDPAQRLIESGNPVLVALGSLLTSSAGIAYLVKMWRGRGNGEAVVNKIDALTEVTREHVAATRDIVKTLDRFEFEARADLKATREKLAEIYGRMEAAQK